jgi:two-component system NtrC family sensor kinase
VLIDEWDELIDECQVGVQRVVSIVKDMREFSQAGGEDRVPVDLADVMRTSVGVAAARCTGGRRIEQHYEPVEPVPCLPGPLRQVFVNLLVNALQAVGPEGTVRVEVCDEPDAVLARVSDDGCGIARGDLHRLFDPFFTTKPTGEGTGLGLSISWHIVKLLGGEIRVHSEPGTGSAFEVRLPKLSASPTSSAPAV